MKTEASKLFYYICKTIRQSLLHTFAHTVLLEEKTLDNLQKLDFALESQVLYKLELPDYVLSLSAFNDFFLTLCSSVYFQISGKKSWN